MLLLLKFSWLLATDLTQQQLIRGGELKEFVLSLSFVCCTWWNVCNLLFKVSSSSSPKTTTIPHPGSVRPGPPPLRPPCLPKSATPSACTWTTSCVPTESGTTISWRTTTSRAAWPCATTGALSTYRRASIGPSSRPRLDRESWSRPSSCSPSLIRVTCGMSESHTYTHMQFEHAPIRMHA